MKPNSGGGIGAGIDYNDALRISNDAIGRISAAYRSAVGSSQNDYSIPLPPSEVPTAAPKASQPLRRGPTDAEIEAAIHPLFDYLDTNNHTLASTLSPDAMQMVMAKLWKQILTTIEALIVPPLSDKPSDMGALSDSELDVALRWLKFLRDFFYAGGDDSGVPLNTLQNAKFNEIMSVRIYYDWNTDDLMEVSTSVGRVFFLFSSSSFLLLTSAGMYPRLPEHVEEQGNEAQQVYYRST